MAKGKLLKVVVKTELEEFAAVRVKNLVAHIPDTDISWNEFFRQQNIRFDSHRHILRSTKHTAFGEDSIQESACLYQRNKLEVKLEERNDARKSSRIQKSRATKRPAQGPVSYRDDTPPIPRLTAVQSQSLNHTQHKRKKYPEEDLPNFGFDKPSTSADYAASMVSSADDEEDDGLLGSDLKEEIIRHIRMVPRSDLLKVQREVLDIKKDFEIRHRWSRRAPLVSTLIFNLFDR